MKTFTGQYSQSLKKPMLNGVGFNQKDHKENMNSLNKVGSTFANTSFSQDCLMNNDSSNSYRPKTKRDKCLKFFTKVGYTKERLKAIPRWCTDMELLDRMVIYQKRNPQIYNVD